MPFADPSPTQVDLHFRLLGFPIRVHPFFWIGCIFLYGQGEPVYLPLWALAVLVSIVVHELGHAMLQRYWGGRPWIVLYAFGGFAATDGYQYSPWRQVAISLAGPGAGFALWGIVRFALPAIVALPEPLLVLAGFLLFINLWWGVFNLLPIYPLDGGQVARELFILAMPRTEQAIVFSLWLSIATCAIAAALVYRYSGWWNMLLLIALAVNNYQTLEGYRWSRRGGY